MLAKRISMKKIAKSSFSGLVDYISNDKANAQRIESINLTNFPSLEHYEDKQEAALAAGIKGDLVQTKNKRSKDDKTYHLLVSFRAGEHPSPQVLKEIEQAYADALGFSEHQRVSAVHTDTDNLHIHIAFNKIHPKNFTIKTPHNDNWTLDQVRESLEEKYGLQRDNHIKDKQRTKTQSQSKAADMEAHSGQESFLSWMQKNLKDELKKTEDWQSFHKLLGEHSVELKMRANGLIFESEAGVRLKGSSLGREFSKGNLEKRLGEFVPLEEDKPSLNPESNFSKAENKPEPEKSAKATPKNTQKKTSETPKKTYQKRPLPLNLDKETADLLKAFEARKEWIKAGYNLYDADYLKKREALKAKNTLLKEAIDQKLSDEFKKIYQTFDEKMKQAGLPKETWSQWKERQVKAGNQEVLEALAKKQTNNIYADYQKERQQVFETRQNIQAEKQVQIEKQKERSAELRKAFWDRSSLESKQLFEGYKEAKAKIGDLRQKYGDWLQEEARSGNEQAKASLLAAERSKIAEKLMPRWKQQSDKFKKEKVELLKEQQERIDKVLAETKLTREIYKRMKVHESKKKGFDYLHQKKTQQIKEIKTEITGRIENLGDGRLSWADWLKKEATKGNEEALEVMRGRRSSLIKRAERYANDPSIQSMSASALAGRKDVEVTKSGTLLFKLGREQIKDDGKNLTLNEKSSDEALLFILTASAKRGGNTLKLTGTKAFQKRMVKLAAQEALDVTFLDPKLEKLRQKETEKRIENEQRNGKESRGASSRNGNRFGGSKFGDSARSFADRVYRYTSRFFHGGANLSKWGFGESRQASPEAESDNRMRDMPFSDMASRSQSRDTRSDGSSMSVPVAEGDSLEQRDRPEGEQVHYGVRREGTVNQNAVSVLEQVKEKKALEGENETFLKKFRQMSPSEKEAWKAVNDYIKERTDKRIRGLVQEAYVPLEDQAVGAFTYEGIRHKNNQSLVLLKNEEKNKIFVLAIDKKTEYRLKQIKLGKQIEIQKGKSVVTQPEVKPSQTCSKGNKNEGR
ncbi:hypothetical protein FAI40_08085 [Acetobacteraceae bacterium]|nr:hypothetical protein FAI40_08085 [Acetobacteraceae bacterium]